MRKGRDPTQHRGWLPCIQGATTRRPNRRNRTAWNRRQPDQERQTSGRREPLGWIDTHIDVRWTTCMNDRPNLKTRKVLSGGTLRRHPFLSVRLLRDENSAEHWQATLLLQGTGQPRRA